MFTILMLHVGYIFALTACKGVVILLQTTFTSQSQVLFCQLSAHFSHLVQYLQYNCKLSNTLVTIRHKNVLHKPRSSPPPYNPPYILQFENKYYSRKIVFL